MLTGIRPHISVCKTPGAIYHIKVAARYLDIGVTLPRGVEIEGLLDNCDTPPKLSPRQTYEDILHDALERAVARILELNANRGEA
jgi:hypothetical protein